MTASAVSPVESFRESLIGYLRQELVGPASPEEVLTESPRQRYSAGVLLAAVKK